MNLQSIEQLLQNPQATPRELSNAKDWLSAQGSYLLEQELNSTLQATQFFNDHRGNYQSDKACTSAWQGTEAGIHQLKIINQQKRIKLLISAISSHLRVLNNEAFNRM